MVLKKATEKVFCNILRSTIMTICRELMPDYKCIHIDGLLGVTMNDEDVVLLSLKDTLVKGNKSRERDSEDFSSESNEVLDLDDQPEQSPKRKRRKSPQKPHRSKSLQQKPSVSVMEEVLTPNCDGDDHAFSSTALTVQIPDQQDSFLMECDLVQLEEQDETVISITGGTGSSQTPDGTITLQTEPAEGHSIITVTPVKAFARQQKVEKNISVPEIDAEEPVELLECGLLPKIQISSQMTEVPSQELYIGRSFLSDDELWAAIDKYSDKTNIMFCKLDCKLVVNFNRKVTNPAKKYPAEKFKYIYLKLGCKHHGKCSSKGNNIRPKQKTMKIGCPAFIHMCVDRKRGGRLVIKDLCMQHNHQVGRGIEQSGLSWSRQLSEEELGTVKALLKIGMPNEAIRKHLTNITGKELSRADISNIKAQLKRKGEIETEKSECLCQEEKDMD